VSIVEGNFWQPQFIVDDKVEMVVIAQDMDLGQHGTESCVPRYYTTSGVVETAGKSCGTAVELNPVCFY
jgi:hypothetical protein